MAAELPPVVVAQFGRFGVSVYAEWHWSCQECDNHSEEPWPDEESARAEHDVHMRFHHPVERGRRPGTARLTEWDEEWWS